jgi:hypothetical protein
MPNSKWWTHTIRYIAIRRRGMKVLHFLFNWILIVIILLVMTNLEIEKWIYYVVTSALIYIIIRVTHKLFKVK